MKLLFLLTVFQVSLLMAQDQPSLPSLPPGNAGQILPQSPRRRIVVATPDQPGNPAGMPETLADNYQITLLINDKNDAPVEISMVTASGRYVLNVGELRLSFEGTVKLEDDGTALIQYFLRWESARGEGNSVQFFSSSVQGVLRTRPDADSQIIFRGANRTIALSLTKVPMAKAR